MSQSRKDVFRQIAVIAVGEVIGLGIMLGVYAILGAFSLRVLLGGLLGGVIAIANFFAMAMVATLAADRAQTGDVAGGQKLLKTSYPIRFLALAGILGLLAKSGWVQRFDLLALLLPLAFVRITLTVWEFVRKKGA